MVEAFAPVPDQTEVTRHISKDRDILARANTGAVEEYNRDHPLTV